MANFSMIKQDNFCEILGYPFVMMHYCFILVKLLTIWFQVESLALFWRCDILHWKSRLRTYYHKLYADIFFWWEIMFYALSWYCTMYFSINVTYVIIKQIKPCVRKVQPGRCAIAYNWSLLSVTCTSKNV